jgi:anti-sigma factor RsiW
MKETGFSGCDALHLYFDGELDTRESLAFEKHLESCAQCRADLAEFRQIRADIQAALTRAGAGAGLRRRLNDALDAETEKPVNPRRWDWRRLAVAAAVVAMISSGGTMFLTEPSEETVWTQGVVLSHERAMLSGHEIDIVSSNRHTVKPWFAGRTTVAPLVPDLAGAGFPLVGGRLDVPIDRAMPAIVYQAGPHVISLYMQPASGQSSPSLKKIDGYSVLQWKQFGFAFTAVSDADGTEIAAFQKAFAEKAATMP